MANFTIQYFPQKEGGSDKYLGGGFIRSDIFSVRFSVFKNSKNASGYNISLPSSKNAQGEWSNDVSFVTKEVSDLIYKEMNKHVNGQTSNSSSASAAAPRKEKAASLIDRNKIPAGSGVPDDDLPPF